MHELSAATSLVELACEKAHELGDVRVEALHLRLGPLAGVVKEALLFSFELAAQGTPIEGARLEIQDMPLTVLCPGAGKTTFLEWTLRELKATCRVGALVGDLATDNDARRLAQAGVRARTGQGMSAWLDRLAACRAASRANRPGAETGPS